MKLEMEHMYLNDSNILTFVLNPNGFICLSLGCIQRENFIPTSFIWSLICLDFIFQFFISLIVSPFFALFLTNLQFNYHECDHIIDDKPEMKNDE